MTGLACYTADQAGIIGAIGPIALLRFLIDDRGPDRVCTDAFCTTVKVGLRYEALRKESERDQNTPDSECPTALTAGKTPILGVTI